MWPLLLNELAMNLTSERVDDRYLKVFIVAQAVVAKVLCKLFAALDCLYGAFDGAEPSWSLNFGVAGQYCSVWQSKAGLAADFEDPGQRGLRPPWRGRAEKSGNIGNPHAEKMLQRRSISTTTSSTSFKHRKAAMLSSKAMSMRSSHSCYCTSKSAEESVVTNDLDGDPSIRHHRTRALAQR
jgi:hypothetical protein